MIKKIDTQTDEFQIELKLTKQYTDQVCQTHSFSYNMDNDINESIQMGLTRNKLIYGKRYCPCFMVEGNTKEEREKANNRLCPCTPALSNEIPSQGHCHCAIFCTKDYLSSISNIKDIQDKEKEQASGLSKDEYLKFLSKKEVSADEVDMLLEARRNKLIEFLLIDTREWMEWVAARIIETDFLIPTTSFYQSLEQIQDKKDIPIILYCQSGSRSAYCQNIMLNSGYKTVLNLDYGMNSYRGNIVSGEKE